MGVIIKSPAGDIRQCLETILIVAAEGWVSTGSRPGMLFNLQCKDSILQ